MKNRYEIDKDNRLIIIRKGKKFIPQGKFIIDDRNKLLYLISESGNWRKTTDLPERIVFEGRWSLEPAHNLTFTLSRTKQQFEGERLHLKADIIDAKADSFVFALATKKKGGLPAGQAGIHKVHLLQFRGKWQSDKYNRLTFLVQRAQSEYDTLTLKGIWEINKNNALIYRYQKTYLKRKIAQETTLAFKGFWQISQKGRISYILETRNGSYFTFKVHPESPSIIGKSGVIKYRLGVGIKADKAFKEKIIALYGAWKFGRKTGISFDVDYGDGRIKEIVFGAVIYPSIKSRINFELKNRQGDDLGLGVVFTRRFLKNNALGFLKLQNIDKEFKIEGGVNIRW